MKAIKTLAAINAALEREQEIGHRAHLGASVIGSQCAREVWYKWTWSLAERFDGRMLRLFDRGQREEERFALWLRKAGIEVWTHNPNDIDPATKQARQFRVSDIEGHFGGSLDGVLRGVPDLDPTKPVLLECKTHNKKSFEKLVEEGLLKSKWAHYIQCQSYGNKMGFEHALYLGTCKDDDEIYAEVVRIDPSKGVMLLERARSIVYAQTPPLRIANSPGDWRCKFCHFQRLCHFGDVAVDRNCRTCRFSNPAQDGSAQWECGKYQVKLNKDAQLAGCDSYEPRPEYKQAK